MLRATLPTSITIEAAVDPNCGCVFMNPTNLHQVIINLCTNASQSLPDRKGTICINLQRQEFSSRDLPPDQNISAGGFVVITVSDTGCGMDKTTENRIFEPYFTTKEKGTGTGLGLAVVHGIVEDCNGFIKIETTVGIGSSFHVYLPASESPAEELPSADEKDIFPSVSKNIRILVVDDDPLLVKISERSLTNNGYYVTSFTDSRKALEAFQNMPDNFDMIITDQTMPGLTGADLAKEVLKVKSSMPIIMCTGHSETVSEENALSLGVKKYVLKPIKGEELLNAVRELLGGE